MQDIYGSAPLERHDRMAGVNPRDIFASTPQRRRGANVYADLAREMDAVSKLFGQWETECEAKRREALRALPFPDFPAALTVFNFRGERRVAGGLAVQDYFFCARRRVSAPAAARPPSLSAALARADADACTRCAHPLPRHADFFLDSAKRRAEADCLCRPCLVAVARGVLGGDDAAVAAEAVRLREARWAPALRPEAAGDLLRGRRTFFS